MKLSHARVGDICGVREATVIAWEKGSKIPAEALAALIPHGLDVWYVLGGRQKDSPQPVMLRPEELELVLLWRDLTESYRKGILAQMRALAEPEQT